MLQAFGPSRLQLYEGEAPALVFQKLLFADVHQNNVLKKFKKFTGKHLCWSLFSNKVSDFQLATLLKRDSGKYDFLRILQNF